MTSRFICVAAVFSSALTVIGVDSSPLFEIAVAQQQVFEPAPVAGSEQPTFFGSLVSMLPMLAVCYLIFYFMVIKPQDQKMKRHKALIDSLKRGDSVVTSGGLVGKFVGEEKGFMLVEIAPNVKIKVEQGHVLKRVGDEQKSEAA